MLGELIEELRQVQNCRTLGPTAYWALDERIASKTLRLLHARIESCFTDALAEDAEDADLEMTALG